MSEEREYDYMFKLVLVGNSDTEKTDLLKSYTKNPSDDNVVSTIGSDFVSIKII